MLSFIDRSPFESLSRDVSAAFRNPLLFCHLCWSWARPIVSSHSRTRLMVTAAGPLAASMCQAGVFGESPGTGAIHERDYDDQTGSSQACFSSSRHRCGGYDGSAPPAATQPSAGVLQPSSALRGRLGSVPATPRLWSIQK